jgi:hypothetical protein
VCDVRRVADGEAAQSLRVGEGGADRLHERLEAAMGELRPGVPRGDLDEGGRLVERHRLGVVEQRQLRGGAHRPLRRGQPADLPQQGDEAAVPGELLGQRGDRSVDRRGGGLVITGQHHA